MSSRRAASTANSILLCPGLIASLEQSRIALKSATGQIIEIGLLCGYVRRIATPFEVSSMRGKLTFLVGASGIAQIRPCRPIRRQSTVA